MHEVRPRPHLPGASRMHFFETMLLDATNPYLPVSLAIAIACNQDLQGERYHQVRARAYLSLGLVVLPMMYCH